MVEYTTKFRDEIQKFYQDWLKFKGIFIGSAGGSKKGTLFVQLLFNRIVLLFFLEKNGLLNGNQSYITDLYDESVSFSKNFYDEYLIPLFFEVLNKEHDSNSDAIILGKNYGKIPYLNGNLFSNDKGRDMKVENDLWPPLFTFLNNYSWSLTDNDFDEFIITPKLLGYVYEKSIIAETGKDNVSYFTPPDITMSIIDSTLIPYINFKMSKKFGLPNFSLDLISKNNKNHLDVEMTEYLLNEVLKNIKIVDNSCGSGAFLIGILDRLFDLNIKCANSLNINLNPVSLKKEIITNNIYGVDIQDDAIELTKLRLWLSLLSEEVKTNAVTPLPNIEYNILKGNSLIGKVELNAVEQSLLFNENSDFDSTSMRSLIIRKNKLLKKYKNEYETSEKRKLKSSLEEIDKNLRERINKELLFQLRTFKISYDKNSMEELCPFHWVIEFPEIFDPTCDAMQRGFDIVIGNPPYGNILSALEKEYLAKTLLSIHGKGGSNNAASVFIESSYRILNHFGRFGMIVPNTIARKDQFRKIRDFILENTTLYQIVDEGNPFRDSQVSLEMISLFFSKQHSVDDYPVKIISKRDRSISKSEVSSQIFKTCGWFVLYYDPMMTEMSTKCRRIGEFGSFFGAARPFKLDSEIKKNGKIRVAKGNSIKPFVVSSEFTIDESNVVSEYIKSLSYPLLILPEVSNRVKAALCDREIIPISGVMIWRSNKFEKDLKYYLLLYLNSSIPSFYFNKYIINRSSLTTHLDSTYLERIPIPETNNLELYEDLCELVLLLYHSNEDSSKLQNIIRTMKVVIDALFINNIFKMGVNLEYHLSDILKNKIEKIQDVFSIVEQIESNTAFQSNLYLLKSSKEYITITHYTA